MMCYLLTVYKLLINYCHATNPLSIRYQRAIYKRSPHPAHAINVRCDHAINVLSMKIGSTCYCYVYCLCAIHVISLNYQLTIDMLSICHRVLCTLCHLLQICYHYAAGMLSALYARLTMNSHSAIYMLFICYDPLPCATPGLSICYSIKALSTICCQHRIIALSIRMSSTDDKTVMNMRGTARHLLLE